MTRQPPATPAEREAIRTLVAQSKTAKEIAAITGRSDKSIVYIVRTFKLGPWLGRSSHTQTTEHIPTDFAQRWRTSSQADLAKHYERSGSTISLWTKRMGLVRSTAARLHSVPKPKPVPKSLNKPFRMHGGHKPPETVVYRDMGPVGLAVEYLRKLSAVSRCREDGRLDPAGMFWRRGSKTLTDQDVVALADEIRAREQRMAA